MPPPTNSVDSRVEVNTSTQFGDSVNEDPTSSSAQTQMLLTVLRNVIIPLIQTALPNQKDLHEAQLGPEAEDLLVALQKYIFNVIRGRSQSDIEAGAKQNVNSEGSPSTLSKTQEVLPGKDVKAHIAVSSDSGAVIKQTVNLEYENAAIPRSLYNNGTRISASVQDILIDLALPTLRAHVFNTMPMHLLCFEKHGSNLDITLLDRTGIYSHLMTKALTQQTILRWVFEVTQYTILSHTWLHSSPGEVTFSDWRQGIFDMMHPGYQKLVNFCRVAAEDHGVTLGWMDTICINKDSSTELDESIRSMYKWYKNAKNCLVYLAETGNLSNMAKDPWFTRGWTLQELLAPRYIAFYSSQWTILGNGLFNDKEDINIQREIESATTITPMELISSLLWSTILRKMQWAANRKVTREEDTAYSLMGIFNISISIAYGEGADLAFMRLVREILNTSKSDVLDLFNWAGDYKTEISSLIPSSPQAYLRRCEFNWRMMLIEPLTITHLGLRIPVVLMPAVSRRSWKPKTPPGDYYSTVSIQPILNQHAALTDSFNILGASFFPSPFYVADTPLSFAFAVLNCGGSSESDILLFKHCFAIAILYTHDNGIVTPTGFKRIVPTRDPISFKLKKKSENSWDDWEYDHVPRSELGRNGMQLVNMYL